MSQNKIFMANSPEISICIPAYKNIPFLKRLLDSVAIQTYINYEVIIADDTPDDSVENFIKQYALAQSIRYYKNQASLGTPENWNESIRRANGKWIKLMHNDDWFENEDALKLFYETAQKYPGISFFYAAFQNVTETTGKKEVVKCTDFDRLFLAISPLHLFKRVYIGNPSCTFIRRDIDLFYDNRFKFVVDFEYYIRCIRKLKKYKYIDKVLLNIGFHDEQVTKFTFLVPAVQIPENFILLEELGAKILRNPFVYDYYWRMFRNLKIQDAGQVSGYYQGSIPVLLKQMILFQSKIPYKFLQIGVISKLLMSANYLISLFRKH